MNVILINFKKVCKISQELCNCGVQNVGFFFVVKHSMMTLCYDRKNYICPVVKSKHRVMFVRHALSSQVPLFIQYLTGIMNPVKPLWLISKDYDKGTS